MDTYYHIDGVVLKYLKGIQSDTELEDYLNDYQEKLGNLVTATQKALLIGANFTQEVVDSFIASYQEYFDNTIKDMSNLAEIEDSSEKLDGEMSMDEFSDKYPDYQNLIAYMNKPEFQEEVRKVVSSYNYALYKEAESTMTTETKKALNDYLTKLQAERQQTAVELRKLISDIEAEDGVDVPVSRVLDSQSGQTGVSEAPGANMSATSGVSAIPEQPSVEQPMSLSQQSSQSQPMAQSPTQPTLPQSQVHAETSQQQHYTQPGQQSLQPQPQSEVQPTIKPIDTYP